MLADATWATMFEMPQIAIIMGCLIPIAGILGGIWYKIEKTKSNNELKRSLIDRGFSVEQIERIIAAGEEEEDE
jgi:hypothetical protein